MTGQGPWGGGVKGGVLPARGGPGPAASRGACVGVLEVSGLSSERPFRNFQVFMDISCLVIWFAFLYYWY